MPRASCVCRPPRLPQQKRAIIGKHQNYYTLLFYGASQSVLHGGWAWVLACLAHAGCQVPGSAPASHSNKQPRTSVAGFLLCSKRPLTPTQQFQSILSGMREASLSSWLHVLRNGSFGVRPTRPYKRPAQRFTTRHSALAGAFYGFKAGTGLRTCACSASSRGDAADVRMRFPQL